MKASLRWLREFVDLPEGADEVSRALDELGVEVEAVEHVDAPFSGVLVARVLEVRPHPDADRIRVVSIDAGSRTVEVVCGAWNFDVGAVVAYAPPGSRLAGGLEVDEREIRGVASPGMICSEAELGLGEDADGIMVLDPTGQLGADLASNLPFPDVVFDVQITSNRPDLMSIHGLARDLGAYFDTAVRPPEVPEIVAVGPSGITVTVVEDELCPRFTAREISGVSVGPSPLWMRLRLRSMGVRPISNVVDVTNYVMLEMGQPLHAFDLDHVAGETIVVRTAEAGEALITLDGEKRSLSPSDLVIADASRALGLAGIMGGGDSEVSSGTTRVLLEAAHFAPGGVLLSGKRHGLRTEASARFERGVDPALPPKASARATAMIVALSGGAALGDLIDVQPSPRDPPRVTLEVGEVERLLGTPVPASETASILTRLGFRVEGEGPFDVTVPSFRPDVTRAADLVEEVARLHGFDKIPARLPKGIGGGLPEQERRRRRLREVLVGAGYFEVMSFDFVGMDEIEALGFAADDPRSRPVRIRNPLSDEQEHLRTTMLPGLLTGVRTNLMRNRRDVALFEIGTVFFESGGPIPDQPLRVGFAATGRVPGVSWIRAGERDALDGVGLVETVFGAFGVGYELAEAAEAGFHPGRAARILVGGETVGAVGELHPDVADAWGLEGRILVGEFDPDALARRRIMPFRSPSGLPPVVFDLAFDLPEGTPSMDLLKAMSEAAGEWLERIVVFDVFTGPPLDAGRKSIAVRLTFRDPVRTLSDEDLVPVREAIASRVATAVSGRLRGG